MPSLRQQVESDAAFAFVEFGLSEEEFFRQTPRQWRRRFDAWKDKQAREDRRTARLCMVMAWCNGNTDATENDFIPKVDEEEQTPDEMGALIASVATKPNGQ